MSILIPGMVLMFWAQSQVKGTYRRYAHSILLALTEH